jgi:acetoin utilization protein AcuB
MTDGVQTVPADMPAVEAWDMMRRRGIRHLVAMAGRDVIGVLSERDAGGRSGAGLRAQSSVGDLMTRRVVTVGPTTTVRRIANLMRGRTIGCVPVMDGRRLVGIVTVSDLLDLLGRGGDRAARPERHALHYRAPHGKHRKGRRAAGVW